MEGESFVKHGKDLRIFFINSHIMVFQSGGATRTSIDAAVEGPFIGKATDKVYDLLEEMTAINGVQVLVHEKLLVYMR